VAFNYEAASRLFRRGEFLSLVQAAGRNHTERKTLDPCVRVIVANALALIGELEDAEQLAGLDRNPPTPPAIRSQAESTFCVIQRRIGNHIAALQHAQSAVFLAQESSEVDRIAWAQLHLFRVLVEIGPFDKAVASLPDTRRLVAKAGNNDATAYLHICVSVLEGQVGRLDEARRHCDIAESLLERDPNVWLSASCLINRGCIAWLSCHLNEANRLFRAARDIASRIGHGYLIQAADTSAGYAYMLLGEFTKAEQTYLAASRDATKDIASRLSSLDGLARVYLASGRVDQAERVVENINGQLSRTECADLIYHVRWGFDHPSALAHVPRPTQ
jgi:tetratricopeptide (TPR) repeat protein